MITIQFETIEEQENEVCYTPSQWRITVNTYTRCTLEVHNSRDFPFDCFLLLLSQSWYHTCSVNESRISNFEISDFASHRKKIRILIFPSLSSLQRCRISQLACNVRSIQRNSTWRKRQHRSCSRGMLFYISFRFTTAPHLAVWDKLRCLFSR